MTPDELMRINFDRSYSPGWASSSANIGRAKASPTMAMAWTPWVSTVRHSRAASKCGSWMVTTVPPRIMAMNALNCPVPCIKGHAGSCTSSP